MAAAGNVVPSDVDRSSSPEDEGDLDFSACEVVADADSGDDNGRFTPVSGKHPDEPNLERRQADAPTDDSPSRRRAPTGNSATARDPPLLLLSSSHIRQVCPGTVFPSRCGDIGHPSPVNEQEQRVWIQQQDAWLTSVSSSPEKLHMAARFNGPKRVSPIADRVGGGEANPLPALRNPPPNRARGTCRGGGLPLAQLGQPPGHRRKLITAFVGTDATGEAAATVGVMKAKAAAMLTTTTSSNARSTYATAGVVLQLGRLSRYPMHKPTVTSPALLGLSGAKDTGSHQTAAAAPPFYKRHADHVASLHAAAPIAMAAPSHSPRGRDDETTDGVAATHRQDSVTRGAEPSPSPGRHGANSSSPDPLAASRSHPRAAAGHASSSAMTSPFIAPLLIRTLVEIHHTQSFEELVEKLALRETRRRSELHDQESVQHDRLVGAMSNEREGLQFAFIESLVRTQELLTIQVALKDLSTKEETERQTASKELLSMHSALIRAAFRLAVTREREVAIYYDQQAQRHGLWKQAEREKGDLRCIHQAHLSTALLDTLTTEDQPICAEEIQSLERRARMRLGVQSRTEAFDLLCHRATVTRERVHAEAVQVEAEYMQTRSVMMEDEERAQRNQVRAAMMAHRQEIWNHVVVVQRIRDTVDAEGWQRTLKEDALLRAHAVLRQEVATAMWMQEHRIFIRSLGRDLCGRRPQSFIAQPLLRSSTHYLGADAAAGGDDDQQPPPTTTTKDHHREMPHRDGRRDGGEEGDDDVISWWTAATTAAMNSRRLIHTEMTKGAGGAANDGEDAALAATLLQFVKNRSSLGVRHAKPVESGHLLAEGDDDKATRPMETPSLERGDCSPARLESPIAPTTIVDDATCSNSQETISSPPRPTPANAAKEEEGEDATSVVPRGAPDEWTTMSASWQPLVADILRPFLVLEGRRRHDEAIEERRQGGVDDVVASQQFTAMLASWHAVVADALRPFLLLPVANTEVEVVSVVDDRHAFAPSAPPVLSDGSSPTDDVARPSAAGTDTAASEEHTKRHHGMMQQQAQVVTVDALWSREELAAQQAVLPQSASGDFSLPQQRTSQSRPIPAPGDPRSSHSRGDRPLPSGERKRAIVRDPEAGGSNAATSSAAVATQQLRPSPLDTSTPIRRQASSSSLEHCDPILTVNRPPTVEQLRIVSSSHAALRRSASSSAANSRPTSSVPLTSEEANAAAAVASMPRSTDGMRSTAAASSRVPSFVPQTDL